MIKRVFIFSDTHIPYQDEATIKVIEKFQADNRFDWWVHLGDLLDFDEISSFNANNLRELETRRLAEDYIMADEFLDRQQAIIRQNNPKAKFVLLEGNHEERMERLLDHEPQLEGLLELPANLKLKERGIQWVKSWSQSEMFNIGKAYFHHGLYLNKYHPAKMVETFGCNIIYGHTHDVQSFVKTVMGNDRVILGHSLGHVANEHKLKYMKKGPSNWCQAFGVMDVHPNGNFNLYPVTIIDHRFSFSGKVYS